MAAKRLLATSAVLVLSIVGGAGAFLTPWCDGRQTIVHLFEWKWSDVANECETVLGPVGFCGVQVSPPQEHRLIAGQPWHQRYQPVSYILDSRSGSRAQFQDMVARCNAVGVRILVDAVINHMAEQHTDGYGSAGSYYVADSYDFPPYQGEKFFSPKTNCPSASGAVSNYENENDVRDCYLDGKLDLYTAANETVQNVIAAYFNDLVDMGVAGFRIDSATNIWPEDLKSIQDKTSDLNETAGFPIGTRPYFYFDVIAPGTAINPYDYFPLGGVTEVQYGKKAALGVNDFSELQNMYDPGLEMTPPDNAVVFVDSHLTQRDTSIPAGELLTFRSPREYQMATAFMLADDYGLARVMSSYDFSLMDDGPPTDALNATLDVVTGSSGDCMGGWVCEHRWAPILNMVEFRNAVAGTSRDMKVLPSGAVTMSRGGIGFFAMAPLGTMDDLVDTGMPAGDYCELAGGCSETITVHANGTAQITFNNFDIPFVAFCAGCVPTSSISTTEISTTDEMTTTEETTSESLSTEILSTTEELTSTPDTTAELTTTSEVTSTTGVVSTTDDITSTTEVVSTTYVLTPTTDVTTEDITSTTEVVSTTDGLTPTTDVTTDDITSTTDGITSTTEEMTTIDTTTDAYSTTDTITTTDQITTTESPYQRTVIFVHKKVYDDQYVFLRGGIDEDNHPNCNGPPVETDECALPFATRSLGNSSNYDKYNAWREGDRYLDWFGAEAGQGSYQGIPASGTPAAWTTNVPGVDGFQELNVYGEDYWMLEMDIDCSMTEDSWFEIKGWLEFAGGFTGWESDVVQQECSGDVGGRPPFISIDHMARCGYINVFTWNEGDCIISAFPASATTTPEMTTGASTVTPDTTEMTTDYLTSPTTEETETTALLTTSTTNAPTTTTESTVKRTVIFVEQHTDVGQDLFLRGGLGQDLMPSTSCGAPATSDPCSLPITTRSLGSASHYDGYDDWRVGDQYLDWYGAEPNQGYHNGIGPQGSPSAWTTNDINHPGHQDLNIFGEAYWMLDIDIDCSLTHNGWFELKGYLTGNAGQYSGWEDDITQELCSGPAGESPPFSSKNHIVKCGFVNVFHFDKNYCAVYDFDDIFT